MWDELGVRTVGAGGLGVGPVGFAGSVSGSGGRRGWCRGCGYDGDAWPRLS